MYVCIYTFLHSSMAKLDSAWVHMQESNSFIFCLVILLLLLLFCFLFLFHQNDCCVWQLRQNLAFTFENWIYWKEHNLYSKIIWQVRTPIYLKKSRDGPRVKNDRRKGEKHHGNAFFARSNICQFNCLKNGIFKKLDNIFSVFRSILFSFPFFEIKFRNILLEKFLIFNFGVKIRHHLLFSLKSSIGPWHINTYGHAFVKRTLCTKIPHFLSW